MVYNDAHLPTCRSFQNLESPERSQVLIDAFIDCCKNLDASVFEPFMEDDTIFEDKAKYLFLASLKELFDQYNSKSVEHLHSDVYVQEGYCQGCKEGKLVKVFSVVLSGRRIFKDQFAYVIEIRNEVLMDIYRCRLFCKM